MIETQRRNVSVDSKTQNYYVDAFHIENPVSIGHKSALCHKV